MRSFPKGESGDRTWLTHPISMTFFAFVCTSIPALLLKKWSDRNLGSITVMALALLIGGIAMWVIDAWASRYEPTTTHVEEMGLGQAIWIGLCQALSAIFPGASRSMTTIAAGQIAGLDRPSALEFSFLLSIPTMLAATGYDLLKELHPGKAALAAGVVPASQVQWTGEHCDCSAHRLRCLVHRGAGRGRVVPGLGAQARLHRLRHLPHHCGHSASRARQHVSW